MLLFCQNPNVRIDPKDVTVLSSFIHGISSFRCFVRVFLYSSGNSFSCGRIYHQKRLKSLRAIMIMATARIIRMTLSPPLTAAWAPHHPPNAFPAARTKP